jgi:hypothetical protein
MNRMKQNNAINKNKASYNKNIQQNDFDGIKE